VQNCKYCTRIQYNVDSKEASELKSMYVILYLMIFEMLKFTYTYLHYYILHFIDDILLYVIF